MKLSSAALLLILSSSDSILNNSNNNIGIVVTSATRTGTLSNSHINEESFNNINNKNNKLIRRGLSLLGSLGELIGVTESEPNDAVEGVEAVSPDGVTEDSVPVTDTTSDTPGADVDATTEEIIVAEGESTFVQGSPDVMTPPDLVSLEQDIAAAETDEVAINPESVDPRVPAVVIAVPSIEEVIETTKNATSPVLLQGSAEVDGTVVPTTEVVTEEEGDSTTEAAIIDANGEVVTTLETIGVTTDTTTGGGGSMGVESDTEGLLGSNNVEGGMYGENYDMGETGNYEQIFMVDGIDMVAETEMESDIEIDVIVDALDPEVDSPDVPLEVVVAGGTTDEVLTPEEEETTTVLNPDGTAVLSDELDNGGVLPSSEPNERRLRGSGRKTLKKTSDPQDITKVVEQQQHRKLFENPTAGIGLFNPLSSNAALNETSCDNSFASLVGTETDVVTVPVGQCYTWDESLTGDVTIGGLDIQGKLVVPKNHKATLYTNYVFVQGVFEMSDDNLISPANRSMKIVLTGDTDVTFTPADSNVGVAGTPFNAGVKPFLVAGGQLNIRGWDGMVDGTEDDAETWTSLIETAEKPPPNPARSAESSLNGDQHCWTWEGKRLCNPILPNSRAGTEEKPLPIPAGCSRQLVNHDFENDAHTNLWTAGDGQIIHHINGSLVLHDTIDREWQGFKLDISEIVQNCPLIANATYLATFRIKIELEGKNPGDPTECETLGPTHVSKYCPRVLRKTMQDSRLDHNTSTYFPSLTDNHADQWIGPGTIGKYGEWFWASTVWTYDEERANPNNVGQTFQIERFELGAKISLDHFILELPSEKSFSPEESVCDEIVVNGDAEDTDGAGYAYYPMYSSDWAQFNPTIMEEVDEATGLVTNKYFQNKGRNTYYHSLRFYPNTNCFVQGFKYNVGLRIRSNIAFKFYIQLCGRTATGDSTCPHILGGSNSPLVIEASEAGVWKSFSQPLLISETLGGMTDVRWELISKDESSSNRAVLDLDDVSIKFESGPAVGLRIDSSNSERWAPGSDVHITSSTLHWRDSQDSVIESATPDTDGSTVLTLATGINAVLSEKETPGMGVEVALLSRNIQISGGDNPEECGYEHLRQADYRGTQSTTQNNRQCQMWSEQTPHKHTRTVENYPDAGLGNHTYCRNPNPESMSRPWCYTTSGGHWDYCNVPKCVGGYLQVLHTPDVPQVIEGVEFTKMGQKRVNNRYPVQMLYTRDVAGTSISRNTIRQSENRCISLDGASNMTIAGNVAYDTAAQCYHIGYEAEDNLLLKNIGSRGNNLDGDYWRMTTFQYRNPANTFINNVAAGTAGRGWNADMDWRTRGEDDKHNGNLIGTGGNMRRKDAGIFRGNKAHSCYYHGMRFYNFEQYFKHRNFENVPVFENTMVYRNREHGIYTYNVIAAKYLGGSMSDNQWGITLRAADGLLLQDWSIVGSSKAILDLTEANSVKQCPYTSWDMVGITMQHMIQRTGHLDPGTGIRYKNVTMSGFDKEKTWYPNCKSTMPIVMNKHEKRDGHFDYISSAEGLNIVDSRGASIDGCRAAAEIGAQDIVITDIDGSLDPEGKAPGGSLVMNNDFVIDILGEGACTPTYSCMAYCPNVCLRTFTYQVKQFNTENWKLKITNTDTGVEMEVPGTIEIRNEKFASDAYASRRFSASLPAGSYTAQFIDQDGNLAWPTYIEELWSKEPDCSGFATGIDGRKLQHTVVLNPSDVTVISPNVTESNCTELIDNGLDADHINYTLPWHHTEAWYGQSLIVGPDEGVNSTDAIIAYERVRHWTGPGQDIDSRCLDIMGGKYYELNIVMKLTPYGDQTTTIQNVDLDKAWWRNQAPVINVNCRKYRDDETLEHIYTHEYRDQASLARPYNNEGWNLLHGIIRLPAEHRRCFIEIERAKDRVDFMIDSASLKLHESDPTSLIMNGDLEDGDGTTKFWDTWGEETRITTVPGYGGVGYAIKAYSRTHYSHAQAQVINTDSITEEGARLGFWGKIKFETNGVTVPCNTRTWGGEERCADLRTYSNKNGRREYHRVGLVLDDTYDTDDGWYTISGIHRMTEHQVGENVYFKMYLDGSHTNMDIIVDNMEVKELPKQCDAMVVNPSFKDGIKYWSPCDDSKERVDLSLVEGVDGVGDYAIAAGNRDHRWRGIMQLLDARCFTPGEEITITAKFKLLNSTGHGQDCDVNRKHGHAENCPNVMIKGRHCEGGDVYWRFWSSSWTNPSATGDSSQWNKDEFNDFSTSFTVNDQLASCKYVWIYVHEVDKSLTLVMDDMEMAVWESEAPTISPTYNPTLAEEFIPTASPSESPTTRPTVSDATVCPEELLTPVEVPSGPIMLARSSALCLLTKAVPDADGTLSNIAPVAMSYDGRDWEKSAGDFSLDLLYGQSFGDYGDGSHITLPALGAGSKYYLTSYEHSISETDQVAGLLETATFGTTKSDLVEFGNRRRRLQENATFDVAVHDWLVDQMAIPATYHRQYFRERTNFRLTNPVSSYRNDHPCDENSRWRKFAFSNKEGDDGVWSDQMFEAKFDNETDTYATVMLNGYVRTLVKPEAMAFDPAQMASDAANGLDYTFEFNKEYEMCGRPSNYVDGWFNLRVVDGTNTCRRLRNPVVAFHPDDPDTVQPANVLMLPSVGEGDLEPIDEVISHGGEYIHKAPLTDALCGNLNEIMEEGDQQTFGKLPDGSWLIFDPRAKLESNTVESPIPDGGGMVHSITGDRTMCANAPRTFLNEEHCELSQSVLACGSVGTPDLMIELNFDNLMTFHDLTGQYVYAVVGLPLIDIMNVTQPSVCELGLRSRWEILDASECTETAMGDQTRAALAELLTDSNDMNTMLRDIDFPITGVTQDGNACDAEDLVEVEIIIGSQCFRRVHPDEYSVFDMTYWTLPDTHPGNMVAMMNNHMHPIKKWIDIDEWDDDGWNDTSVILKYPAFYEPVGENDTLAPHPIHRWNTHSTKFSKIGRFGDLEKFVDLPNELRLDEVATHFGAETGVSGGGILVCGSPREVENDPELGQVFEITHGRDTAWNLHRQREWVWYNIAIEKSDQLRQRMAWALAQVLVIARDAIAVQGSHTEVFLGYYDIFVEHAFGNYRDVLRKISHSPIMAENLSFLQSKSAAYMWENDGKVASADENFAREIMQLFSTGTLLLNRDGTPVRDINGKDVLAYTNAAIESFAKIWTGFDYQQKRGNVEETSWSGNRHDPMQIQSQWRDKFPKTDMTGGYIGDGYPLCVDLPDKMFLKKGASYRLLGRSHMPQLMQDHSYFRTDPYGSGLKKIVLDSSTSALGAKLCNADTVTGDCQWQNTVTLENAVGCEGEEVCSADTLRVVEVVDSSGSSVHYEYVRPACVEQAFYANPRKVIWQDRNQDSSCANPLLPYASEACCDGQQDTSAERAGYLYDGERVPYSSAESRCDAAGKEMCDFNHIDGIDWYKKGYHWTPDSCTIHVKIDYAGKAAIVYEPSSYAFLHPHVRLDNRNFFQVYWEGGDDGYQANYPKNNADVEVGNSCGNNTCTSLPADGGGGCLCKTSIKRYAVFKDMPKSVDDALSKLTMGAYDTSAYDEGSYVKQDPLVSGITVYFAASGKPYDMETVFEVEDAHGRLLRFKNTKEVVRVGEDESYAFRNAPSFMSVLNSEATARDAHYETEAALDHYFHHPNTPPFLAHRFIQRLTSSNPSPSYVEAVATAFTDGSYDGIGNGVYGDLKATVAAIYLHSEARSVHLQASPFNGVIREPAIKVMAFMRGMEIQKNDGYPIVKLGDLYTRIGEAPHSMPSVFNFYLAEYAPDGAPGAATMVSPEAMITDMPMQVNLFNALYSLIDYGVSSNCASGLGHHWTHCHKGVYDGAPAYLAYEPPASNAVVESKGSARQLQETLLIYDIDEILDELNTILASGRLANDTKAIIKDAYLAKRDESGHEDAFRLAQKLVASTPEFQTTSIVRKTGEVRDLAAAPESTGAPYQALAFVMFSGGADSYNMLVPHTCTIENEANETLWDEYVGIRDTVALNVEELNELNPVTNQKCEKFGLHPNLPALADLFNTEDLLFFANTGVLTKMTNRENYWRDTETQLFAHNRMQEEAQRVDPMKEEWGTGWIGRIRDVLENKQDKSVGAFSVAGAQIALIGPRGEVETPMVISGQGITKFDPSPTYDNMTEAIDMINGETTSDSGAMADWYSETLHKSLGNNKRLHETLSGRETIETFPNTGLCNQMSLVTQIIDSRHERGADLDVFFLNKGGWDTHTQVIAAQQNLYSDVNTCFSLFQKELEHKGVWDNTVLIQVSDFARTNNPNANAGTDHAWGGNYIMMGGSVKGGQIAGDYPHLKVGAPLEIGRGRMIPTTPWEAPFAAIAGWLGIEDDVDREYILPNIGNFDRAEDLFETDELFDPVPTNEPTGSPSSSPTTLAPVTASPTTAEPTSASPTTAEPTSASPTSASPTSASPTTLAPVTDEPTSAEPTTAEPTTAEPSSASPTSDSPTASGTADGLTDSPTAPGTGDVFIDRLLV